MYLTELLKKIIELEGIPESDVLWEELDWFQREHKGHGTYKLEIHEDEDGKIESLCAVCEANLDNSNTCSHEYAPASELAYSILYQRKPTHEQELQKQRREGRLKVIEEGGKTYLEY